jgi:hypothetical protein
MSPRILRATRCPHCRSELPHPTPRVCPDCGGSLQKRFLTAGCLTSAPPIVLAITALGFGARASLGFGARASADFSAGAITGRAGAPAPRADEPITTAQATRRPRTSAPSEVAARALRAPLQ